MRHHTISFKHAWDGVVYAFLSQPNFRFHLFAAVLVSLAGLYFRISSFEWLFLIFTFTFIITAEMINTALEAMVDLLSPERNELAKVAKDTSAGMVLLATIGAVMIGVIVFVPHIFNIYIRY